MPVDSRFAECISMSASYEHYGIFYWVIEKRVGDNSAQSHDICRSREYRIMVWLKENLWPEYSRTYRFEPSRCIAVEGLYFD